MLWRHLFEQHIASPQFVNQQLAFERLIYHRITQCHKINNTDRTKAICVKQNEIKLQQYGLAIQWLIRQREKRLQQQIKECKGEKLLECADKKSILFVNKYFQKDKKFSNLLRQQLKNQNP